MSRFDDINPYESPQSQLGPRIEETPLNAVAPRFTVGDVFSRSWQVFKARMGLCIGLAFLPSFVNFGAQAGSGAFQQLLGSNIGDGTLMNVASGVMLLVTTIFSVFISIGQSVGFLNVARERPGSVGNIFGGGAYFVPVVVGWLILSLLAGGGMLLGALPGVAVMGAMGQQDPTALLVLGVGLVVAFAVVLLYSIYISQFIFVAIDHPGLGAWGSIRESMRITKGRVGTIAALYLIAGLVNLVGFLMLLVGLIITIPFSLTIIAVMYTALTGKTPLVAKADESFVEL